MTEPTPARAPVRVVAWDRLDIGMENALLNPVGLARRVVQSMIATTGGNGGGSTVIGASPVEVRLNDDGTGTLTVLHAGATITDLGDGSFRLTINGGQ